MKMTKNGTYSYSYVGTYNRLAKFQTLSIALLPSGAIYIVCLVLFFTYNYYEYDYDYYY